MAYIYTYNYFLNKSGSKNIAVALEITSKESRVLLSKGQQQVEIHLTTEEFKLLADVIPSMSMLLRQDLTSNPHYITDNLRVQVVSNYDMKQVLLERLNENKEVKNALYYCLPTWLNLESIIPCVDHLLGEYAEHAIKLRNMMDLIVNFARSKKPEVNFATMHLNAFQKLMLKLNPAEMDMENYGHFDPIRCYYELVIYHPYLLALAFHNLAD